MAINVGDLNDLIRELRTGKTADDVDESTRPRVAISTRELWDYAYLGATQKLIDNRREGAALVDLLRYLSENRPDRVDKRARNGHTPTTQHKVGRPRGRKSGRKRRNGEALDQVVAYTKSRGSASPTDAANALGLDIKLASSYMSRAMKQGRLKRLSRGRYEWVDETSK